MFNVRRLSVLTLLTKDEARRIAANIAKLRMIAMISIGHEHVVVVLILGTLHVRLRA
jgi:hypothetical protein